MRSSSGQHFVGLDHIRALAAFMVVTWHFSHSLDGSPVPFNRAPELGLLDEGHVGVSLFMVLSGYLFTKLIAGRPIDYPAFLWNRAIRLLPLFGLVLLFVAWQQSRDQPLGFVAMLLSGLVYPTLPNGGWSITAEAHFYFVLPLLLWAAARWRFAPLALVAVAIGIRLVILASGDSVQDAAYWTIIGRFDQFALGIYFCQQKASGRCAAAALLGIAAIYAAFDMIGGFYAAPDWPWVILPTVEGLAFGAIISWYDANPIQSPRMWLVQKAGEYSYSIYLLHFFFVFEAARLVHEHLVPLNSLYAALPWALLFFIGMTGIGHLTYKVIEEPPLRWRKSYIRKAKAEAEPALAG